MSKEGDVVWAMGTTWQRDNTVEKDGKDWWYSPTTVDKSPIGETLKFLKKHDDFLWLVFNGEVMDNAPEDKTTVDWENGWLAGMNNACQMLNFDTKKHSSLRSALDEREKEMYTEGYSTGWVHGNHSGRRRERDAIVRWLRKYDVVENSRVFSEYIQRGDHHE